MNFMLLDKAQAFSSAGGAQHREPERLEQLTDQIPLHWIVIDDQDGLPWARIATHVCLRGRDGARARHLGEQQLYPEYAADARRADDRDLAAHGFNQHFGDGQAEAGAGGRPRRPGASALERPEHAAEVMG